jgi:PA14 domain
MNSSVGKMSLATLLVTLLMSCGQPPAPPSNEFEVSDENGNSVTAQAVPMNGLKGEYFDNIDFTGTMKTRYDATVNRNWGTAAPITGIQPTTYSVRWTGQIKPAFSETYTFRVTSSDGTRLMVNGQVLVNDWIDGSSRVRTGAVALQANVTYDIRLEYYRNATNAGSVKLEWQSPSRTRQVVPQANLFTTGSNIQTAIATVQTNANYQALNVSLDATQSFGILDRTGSHLLIARETSGFNHVIAMTKAGVVRSLFRLQTDLVTATMTDVMTKSKVELGNLSLYFGSDWSQTSAQRQAFISRLVPVLSNGAMQGVVSMSGQQPGRVQPQGIIDDLCDWLPPPPSCGKLDAFTTFCKEQAEAYRDAVCVIADLPETIFSGIGSLWDIAKQIAGMAPAYNNGDYSIPDKWDEYQRCIAEHSQNCTREISVSPESKTVPAVPVDTGDYFLIQINNIGVQSVDASRSPVGIEGRATVINSGGTEWVQINPSEEYFKILPGQLHSVPVFYLCPPMPTELNASILIFHNATNQPSPIQIPVKIECSNIRVSVYIPAGGGGDSMASVTPKQSLIVPAFVAGDSSNQGVTWHLNGPGSITSNESNQTVTYTAPSANSTYPAYAQVKLTARSRAKPSIISNEFIINLLPIQWKYQISSTYCTNDGGRVVNYADTATPHTGYGACGDDPRDIVNAAFNLTGNTSGIWTEPETVNARSYFDGHKITNSELYAVWVPISQLP